MKYFILLTTLILTISFSYYCLAVDNLSPQHTETEVLQMELEASPPKYLYKIISLEDWEKSLLINEVAHSLMDEAFFHLAKEEQVEHVALKFWNQMDHIVLKLSSEKLIGHLVYETNPGGSTKYYHLYDGIIPLDAVVNITIKRYN